jgi:hypothetical protein
MHIWSWFRRLLGFSPQYSPLGHNQQAKSAISRQQPYMTATEMLERIAKLQAANAQWPEIWQSLNPDSNHKVQAMLVELRGPHMFAPHVGLNVILQGCQRALASDANADQIFALQTALRNCDTIVRPH